MKRIVLFVSLLISLTLAAQNPLLLRDVYPGATGSGIGEIVKTNNYTFFTAEDDDGDPNKGLYRTDGTPAGTIKLDLTYPTYISTKAEKLKALGDKVIFSGDNFYHYGEVWVSDGTQAGTIALERFQPATPRTNLPTRRVVMDMAALGNSVLYGVKNNDDHLLLKKTDGTPGAMTVVYDFGTFSHPDTDLALFKVINGILYFNLYDVGAGIDQLWRSDGTTAGTYMIKDFGLSQFVASYYMPAGNNFYIILVTPGTGNVLWKSDGTESGTQPVKVISDLPYGPVNNNYPSFAALGSTLYFTGLDAAHGKELWKTDGTEDGTVLVADINAGTGSSLPASLTVFNNTLYFSAEGSLGKELYRYTPGAAAPVLVSDIAAGTASSSPGFLTVSNNTLVFAANKDGSGHELWITDGTSENTRQLADINPSGAANPSLLTALGNDVIFSANDGTNGAELHKYDNTDGVFGITYKTLYVNDNSTSGDIYTRAIGNDNNRGSMASPFATITRALQAAQPGDIIYVDAGSYIDQVVVDKSITIKGAGAGVTTIHMPNAMNVNFMSGDIRTYAVLHAADLDKVTLQDFAVDGGNKVFDGRLYGIALRNTGGEISHCEVRNFRNTNPYNYAWSAGTPLYVTAGATPRSVSLHNNRIHDYFFYGMLLTGTALTVDVHDNVITGNGVADFAQYGITLSYATGAVYNNTISNMVEFTAAADTESAGITLSNAGNTSVYNNRLIDCEAGIITNGGSYTIRENDIRGSVLYGIESYALNAGSATLIIEHNIVDNQPYGIYIFNGGTGSVHATLTSNSITNSSVSAIRNENATVAAYCNWLGAAQAQAIAPLVAGDVTYSPWLVDGTDSDPAATGFQPAANTCVGTPVVITPGAVTPVSCFGETDGAAAVSVSGGSLPYTYAWGKEGDAAFVETTENLSFLAAGTYTLLVTDAVGSTATHTVVITEPNLLAATVGGTNVLCNGGTDGSASVAVGGGTAPYTYSWSNGSTESALSDLAAGTYTVTATDANGCTATGSYTVTQPAPLNGAVDASDVTCHGAGNGVLRITARGGVAPYQYSLNDGSYGPDAAFDGLLPGTYTVKIKDANSCIYTETIAITEPEPLSVATASVTGTCAGSSNGSINVTVSGGTSRYSYSWTGADGFSSSREDLSNLAAGTYDLVVTDANGCTASHSVAIEEESAIDLDGSVQDVTCFGSATGVIDLMVSGGSATNTYSWTGPKGFKATTQDINNVTAGIYTVIVTSVSGCSMQATYTVSQPAAALQVTATKTDIMSCDGTGSLAAVATGGVAPYAYSINDGSPQEDGSFKGLSAGSYTVSVTDSKGCVATTTLSIVDNGGDLYEANERQSAANPIQLEEAISARLAARDKDWFRFTASTIPMTVHKVSVTRSTNGYLFDLYDSRGRVVSPISATATEKVYSLAAGAAYAVQVSGTASLDCYQLSVTTDAPVTQTRSTEAASAAETALLEVKAYPNPSAAHFSVLLQGSSRQPLSVRVLDNLGRVVEARNGVAPNTTFTLGAAYRPGIYHLEVRQGSERKTIRLVKQSS